jgi:hypothetical protein
VFTKPPFSSYRKQTLPVHTITSSSHYHFKFLDAFSEQRKAIIRFIIFVHPSTWNSSCTTGRIFLKFDI